MSIDAGDAAAAKSPETMDLDLNFTPSEESKGGIKYDVLIGEPKVVTPRMHAGTVRPLSAEIIQLKITAAAERRKSLESLRLAPLNDRLRRIEEPKKKQEEELIKFSTFLTETPARKTICPEVQNLRGEDEELFSSSQNAPQEYSPATQAQLLLSAEKQKGENFRRKIALLEAMNNDLVLDYEAEVIKCTALESENELLRKQQNSLELKISSCKEAHRIVKEELAHQQDTNFKVREMLRMTELKLKVTADDLAHAEKQLEMAEEDRLRVLETVKKDEVVWRELCSSNAKTAADLQLQLEEAAAVKDALDLRICKLERNLEDVCLHSTTPHKNPVHQAVQYDALLEAANTSFGLLSMREGSEESVVDGTEADYFSQNESVRQHQSERCEGSGNCICSRVDESFWDQDAEFLSVEIGVQDPTENAGRADVGAQTEDPSFRFEDVEIRPKVATPLTANHPALCGFPKKLRDSMTENFPSSLFMTTKLDLDTCRICSKKHRIGKSNNSWSSRQNHLLTRHRIRPPPNWKRGDIYRLIE